MYIVIIQETHNQLAYDYPKITRTYKLLKREYY